MTTATIRDVRTGETTRVRVVEREGRRTGQKRTFSAQKQEWITMNREPAHRVAVQVGMWAGGAA